MIPAHLFNRCIILVPMFISVLLGAHYYDIMLITNGFQPVGDEISDS